MDAEPYLSGLEGMEHDHFRQVNLNISDVIDAIQTTDPEFVAGSSMFAGGGASAVQPQSAYIKIVEQPAPKQLRFRYECEGRSAGSIPGVKSTPENKTFPTIQIVGYSGKACVVVSCVTKDPPYRPHPHNLVGKEGCKKGICTVPVSGENVTVSFSNLGIQCVKKKDIDEALKLREEIRVDPFHTGFEHRRQPTSIDLNAVRLCFQVFIEDPLSPARYTRSLPPVVSEPIYDKKAMSDLVICRLSASSCSVAGGQELMLFCEKVAKEDIQVRFYEEKDGGIAWEGYGDFQPTHVHKQVGIAFRTPRYRTLEIDKPVKAWIQLRRPSDGATSEPLPFEFIPLESGRPAFWSLRKAMAKKGNYNVFSSILASNTALLTGGSVKTSIETDWASAIKQPDHSEVKSSQIVLEYGSLKRKADASTDENQNSTDVTEVEQNEISNNKSKPSGYDYAAIQKWKDDSVIIDDNANITQQDKVVTETENIPQSDTCKTLNELLTQVAELDDIYSDTRARLLIPGGNDQNSVISIQAIDNKAAEVIDMDVEDLYDEDDNQTYSSLQMAMKNPIEFLDASSDRYEDVIPEAQVPQGPIILIGQHSPSHKREIAAPENADVKLPPLPPKRIRKSPPAPPARPEHPVSHEQVPVVAPNKILPPPPDQGIVSPKQIKPNIFQKLFSKKSAKGSKRDVLSTPKDGRSREGSVGNISSTGSQLHLQHEPDSVLIPLTGPEIGDLTEAEHYALYTDMAPHATASEFDEMSFYYSPVEGGEILKTKRDLLT